MKLKPLTVFASVALAVAALQCGVAQAQTKTIRMVPHADLKTLDPMMTTAYITRNNGYMIFDTLFAQNSKGAIKPEMVDTWTESKDGLNWTFTLRKGLVFSDGTPVTSADCIASIERWAKKDNLGRAMFANGAVLTAISPKSFSLSFKQSFGLVLDALSKPSGYPLFMMPERLAKTDPNTPITEMLGSGPFLFSKSEWVPGSKVVYLKNPRYVPRAEPADGLAGGKVVKVDRVEWDYLPDSNTAVNALKSGEVDMLESVPPDFISALQADKDVTVSPTVGAEGMLVLNQLHPPFNNVKARQAIYYLISQEKYIASLGYPAGFSLPYCGSLYTCKSPLETTAGSAPYRHADLAKAKALMKDAGYNGEKVVILYATDQPISVVLQLLAQDLKKIGVKVDLQSMDWASVASRRQKKNLPDQGGWSIFNTFAGYYDAGTPVTNPWLSAACGNSLPGWPCDAELDKLRAAWVAEPDPLKRKALSDQIQARGFSVVPYVMWGQYFPPIALSTKLKDYGPMKSGIPVMWNVQKQ